jgi:hypothetical protein
MELQHPRQQKAQERALQREIASLLSELSSL